MAQTRDENSKFRYSYSKNIAGGNVAKSYYKHAIVYGLYLDVRTYKHVKTTFRFPNSDKSKRLDSIKREDSLSRARISLFRLITGNVRQHGRYTPLFITYTFADNCTDLKEANHRFKLYLSKLRYSLGRTPRYVVVPERQERGAWHFHSIWFDLPRLDFTKHDLMWGQGSQAVTVKSLDRDGKPIRSVTAYLTKYLSKASLKDHTINKKVYYCSKNLIRPFDVFNTDTIADILSYDNVELLSTYEGINYTQVKYKLKKQWKQHLLSSNTLTVM